MNHIVDRLHELIGDHLDEYDRVILSSLVHIITNQEAMMATLHDIQAAAEADLAKAQSEQNALTAIQQLLQSQQAKIADLTTQLNAAIASGADPATLQAISDELTQTNTALDANAAAEAAMANTTPPAGTTTPPTQVNPPSAAGPVITSITPDNGAAGDTVVINGKNFIASESVSFGGVNVAPTDLSIDALGTLITTKVPVATTGPTVSVTVTSGNGTSNSVAFTYGASSGNTAPVTPPASS